MFKRIAVLSMVFALVASLSPNAAFATTVKARSFSGSVVLSKVPSVKKGTTKITVTNKQSWVKFKAPSTRTYTFTVSKVTTNNSAGAVVATLFQKAKESELAGYKVQTNQGKRYFMLTYGAKTSKKYKGKYETFAGERCKIISKNYAKLSLKKGKTVYIRSQANGTGSFNLTIA